MKVRKPAGLVFLGVLKYHKSKAREPSVCGASCVSLRVLSIIVVQYSTSLIKVSRRVFLLGKMSGVEKKIHSIEDLVMLKDEGF